MRKYTAARRHVLAHMKQKEPVCCPANHTTWGGGRRGETSSSSSSSCLCSHCTSTSISRLHAFAINHLSWGRCGAALCSLARRFTLPLLWDECVKSSSPTSVLQRSCLLVFCACFVCFLPPKQSAAKTLRKDDDGLRPHLLIIAALLDLTLKWHFRVVFLRPFVLKP